MGLVSLVATVAYPYDGRSLQRGDRFYASEKDAHLLKITGKAVDALDVLPADIHKNKPPAPDESQDAASHSKPKRRYRRKDMAVEQP